MNIYYTWLQHSFAIMLRNLLRNLALLISIKEVTRVFHIKANMEGKLSLSYSKEVLKE